MKMSYTAALNTQSEIEKNHPESYYFLMAAREIEHPPICPKCDRQGFPCLVDKGNPSKVSCCCPRCKIIFFFSEEEERIISTNGQDYAARFSIPPF